MKKMQKLLLVAMLVIVATTLVVSTGVVMAEDAMPAESGIVLSEGFGVVPLADQNIEAEEQFGEIKSNILYVVNSFVIPALMTLVSIVALIMGILNCVKYFKSTEEEARAKAKKNLIGWFIGLVLAFAMIWLLPMFIDMLVELMPSNKIEDNFNLLPTNGGYFVKLENGFNMLKSSLM